MVSVHSTTRRTGPCRCRISGTLSSTTAATLSVMATSRATSKARPAAVSDSKITSYRRARQRGRRLTDLIVARPRTVDAPA
jgi:hypothetical protein